MLTGKRHHSLVTLLGHVQILLPLMDVMSSICAAWFEVLRTLRQEPAEAFVVCDG
jgi:hypothetical protein